MKLHSRTQICTLKNISLPLPASDTDSTEESPTANDPESAGEESATTNDPNSTEEESPTAHDTNIMDTELETNQSSVKPKAKDC